MTMYGSVRTAAAPLGMVALLLTGCVSATDGSNPVAGRPEPTPTVTPSPTPTVTSLEPLPEFEPMEPGTYVMKFIGSNPDAKPWAVIEVTSDTFRHNGVFLLSGDDTDFRAVGLWTVAEVTANPCYGESLEWVDPGPTVEDLATALATQPLKNGTDPVPVVLAGYEGLYVETTLPTDVGSAASTA